MTDNRWLVLLAAFCVLATLALRFHDLGHMLVWHDEVYSVARVFGIQHRDLDAAVHDGQVHSPAELLRLQHQQPGHGLNETLSSLQEHPEHGPLYYLTAWVATDWVSDPIVALRGTSVALGLLLFPAIFWLARELFDRRSAWLALALIATSPLFFLFAREARQYAFWIALIAAASAALLRALRQLNSTGFALYAGLLTLALYTHLLTGQVMLAHALFLLMLLYRQWSELIWVGKRVVLAWGIALISFIPWFLVILERMDALQNFTGWMNRAVSLNDLVTGWLGHVNRLFVDLPGAESFWPFGALLLLLALIWFLRHAPRQPRLFLGALILIPIALVVLPDLLFGGLRSLQARYLLPLLLALQLMLAWSLSHGLGSLKTSVRITTLVALLLLITGGIISQYVISRADNWWTKSFSAENAAFARLINASQQPLIVGSYSETSAGEILSLAHQLDPHVRILMENPQSPVTIPSGYSDFFALTPSESLQQQLQQTHKLAPFADSWKWFIASPQNSTSR